MHRAFEANPNVQVIISVGESPITNTPKQLEIITKHDQVDVILHRDAGHAHGDDLPRTAEVARRMSRDN